MGPTDAEILESLRAENAALRQQIATLRQDVADLTKQLAETRAALAQAEHMVKEAARQAAPFRRREASKVPAGLGKKPGRPTGHVGVNRPDPPVIHETISVPLVACPECQGAVTELRPIEQIVEEIPVVTPQATKIITQSGWCATCRRRVRSTHPRLAGHGHNASRCQLGPRALALACQLNKQFGLTMRKTCAVLKTLAGLTLSPGGLSQAVMRVADRLRPDFEQLKADVRAGPATYVDETGWWLAGSTAWLHVFTNLTTTLFVIDRKRDRSIVEAILTTDYRGTLVSDCLSTYDRNLMIDRKHKCIAHHLKAIREQLDVVGPTGDRTYLEAWTKLFRDVCRVWRLRHVIPETLWTTMTIPSFERRCDELLDQAVTREPDKRIQNRLRKQRPHLLTCLTQPDVEPTNNRAERALRPAVIARKLSAGNKTQAGAHAFTTLASLFVTLTQRCLDPIETLSPKLQIG